MKIHDSTAMLNEQAQQYNEYLSLLQDTIRVDYPSKERTAKLVEDAKGSYSIRSFANLISVNPSSLSRIISGQVGSISLDLLARIAACASPASEVTLDKLMDAQGLAYKTDIPAAIKKYIKHCRRILADELLSRGHSVSYTEKPNSKIVIDAKCDFSINTNALTGTDSIWLFDVKLLKDEKTERETLGSMNCLMNYMAFYYRGGHAGRITMVVNNPNAFERIKQTASTVGPIPDEISIMLISVEEGHVIDEFIIPLKDGRCANRLIDMEVAHEC